MTFSIYSLKVSHYGIVRSRIAFSPALIHGETVIEIAQIDFISSQPAKLVTLTIQIERLHKAVPFATFYQVGSLSLGPNELYGLLLSPENQLRLTIESIKILARSA